MPRNRSLPLSLLTAVAAMVVAAVAPAEAAKKRSCKNKKEESGCKLPANARYSGQKQASGNLIGATVTIQPGTVVFSMVGGTAGCKASSVTRVVDRVRKTAKVGKTYSVDLSSQSSTTNNRFKGTMKFSSAGSATLKGRYSLTDRTSGATVCSFSPKVALKRAS